MAHHSSPISSFRAMLSIALLALISACSPAGTDDASQPSNGILLPVASDPTVSFGIWFKVGSQDDPMGKEGLAQLTANLLSSGATSVRSYEEILEALYPLASSYAASVDKEMTVIGGRTHSDNLEAFLELYSDAYLHPAFSERDFDRLKSNQLNFLQKSLRYSQDEELAKAALLEQVFVGTRYRHPSIGTEAGLASITLDDVKHFYATYYTRDNAVIALGGGFEGALVERFERSVAELPPGNPAAVPSPQVVTSSGRRVTLVDKPGADASISFGFPIDVHRGERDYYALWIANSWLGEHRNSASHLYQVIREARGMNYGDYSYIEAFPRGGFRNMPPTNVARRQQIFEVWIRTLPNRNAIFALRAALREIDLLVEQGLSEEQFELTRTFLTKYHLHFAETTQNRLGYAIDDRFYGIEEEGHLAKFRQMMGQITREEVNAALRQHLQTANLQIAIVSGEATGLSKALIADAPSPIEYPAPKPAEVLSEDEEISTYPLAIAADAVQIVSVEDIFAQ